MKTAALPRPVVARRFAELLATSGVPLEPGHEVLVVSAVPGEGCSTTARLLAEGLESLGIPAVVAPGDAPAPVDRVCVRDGGAVLTPTHTDPLLHVPAARRLVLVTLAGHTPGGVVKRAHEELARRSQVPVEMVLNDKDNPTVRGELAAAAEKVSSMRIGGRSPFGALVARAVSRWVLVR